MGDGVEPMARAFLGCVGAGLVGLVHGAFDETKFRELMPQWGHEVATYAPFLGASLLTATSKYGLGEGKLRDRVGAGATTLVPAIIAESVGYTVGRLAVFGIKQLPNYI